MLLDIVPETVLEPNKISISLIDSILDKILENAIVLGQRIIIAAIIFFVGRWVIGWLRRLFNRFLERRHIEDTVKTFLDSLVSISLKLVLFLFIVNILGVSTTSFAAILAAAGLAVGMAMKDNLSNFAGGVMLLVNKPFKVGDRILSQGMDGTVQSIGILYTILLTGDNRTIYIPNGPLSTGNIINYSTQKERRIDFSISISYGANLNELKKILSSIIESEAQIKNLPVPFIGVTTLNNGTIDVTIRVWVDTGDYGAVSVSLNEKIYSLFTEKGIYTPSTLSVRMLKD